MSAGQYAPRGPLWADIKPDRDSAITLPRAFAIAALIEILLFLIAFYMPVKDDFGTLEQQPMSVELVKLPEPPKKEEPPPEPPKVEPKPLPEPPPPKPIVKPEPPKPVVKPEPPKVEIKPEPKIEPKIIIPEAKPEPIPEPKVEPPPVPPPPKTEPVPEPVVQAPPPEPVKEPPPPVETKAEPSDKIEAPKQVRNAKPIHKVAATYPKSALREGKTGKVKARLTVGEDGHVLNVEILESEPPGVFDDTVTKAVKQYRFEADGSRYLVDQVVKFNLEN